MGNVLCFPSFPWLSIRYLIAGVDDALLHLGLESAVGSSSGVRTGHIPDRLAMSVAKAMFFMSL